MCLTDEVFDVTRLAILREFAHRGTVAGTAEAMGYTPSAISQQLSALEREAGTLLTVRAGRRLVLTPAGQRLAMRAGQILEQLEAARVEMAHNAQTPQGLVKVAVFQSAALALVPPAVANLAVSHPGITVRVTQVEPAQALADTWAREHDLVIAEEYPHHSTPHYQGLDRRPLIRDEIRLCATGRWAHAVSVAQLRSAPWVMEPQGTATRHFAEQLCRTAGFEPDIRFVSPDLQAHARYIEEGLCVGLLPGLMWRAHGLQTAARPLSPPAWRTIFTSTRTVAAADRALVAVRDAFENVASSIGELPTSHDLGEANDVPCAP